MNMTNIVLNSTAVVTCSLVPAIGGTPVVIAYYKTVANLMELGHSPLSVIESITNRTRAIIAEIDGQIAGFILFGLKSEVQGNPTWIFLSYVYPEYRRRGVYKMMYSCLESHSRSLGSCYTESYVAFNNTAMISAAVALGREPIATKLLDTQPSGYYVITNRFKMCS
jgi:GNAT superfamily N-acetyltransferase